MDQPLFDYLKKKRNSLLSGRKHSKKALDIIDSINMVEKCKRIGVPANDEREAHNIRSWISNNRKHLKPELRDIRTTYKKNERIIYIYRESVLVKQKR